MNYNGIWGRQGGREAGCKAIHCTAMERSNAHERKAKPSRAPARQGVREGRERPEVAGRPEQGGIVDVAGMTGWVYFALEISIDYDVFPTVDTPPVSP